MLKIDEYKEDVVWFKPLIPRKRMKQLTKRDNKHAMLNFGLWFLLLAISGYSAYISINTWLMLPAFLVYGIIFNSSTSRWHECSHGTVFKTYWINDFFYWLLGSIEFRDNVESRWSHTTHHSYTLLNPVDPENLNDSPPKMWILLLDFFSLYSVPVFMFTLISHSLNIPSKKAKTYVPEEDYNKMFWMARAALLPHLIMIVLSIVIASPLPIVFFSLPKFYGNFINWTFIVLQHVGLQEDVMDHRKVCRSFKVNPVIGFLLLNMQYHTEHHMFPLVPYHQLPHLSKEIANELPPPYHGFFPAIKELIPVLIRQNKGQKAIVNRMTIGGE